MSWTRGLGFRWLKPMVDVVSPDVRSRMMAGIGGKNTKPELVIRKGLHALGFRFLVHDRRLPGKPDIVLPKWQSVIFVNGCFWHGHDCHLFKWPESREEFWRDKIARNKENDLRTTAALRKAGWRVALVWECALKGRAKLVEGEAVNRCAAWLSSQRPSLVVAGNSSSDN